VGVGWLKEEFEALDSPDFDERWRGHRRVDRHLQAALVDIAGQLRRQVLQYTDIRSEPFPLQKPHPPIWVGGHSRAALRRTARHGDGWHPVGAIAASPLPPGEMRTLLDSLKQMTAAEGRDFAKLTISYKAPLYDTGVPDRAATAAASPARPTRSRPTSAPSPASACTS
jgi:alkanesulfonate monooxygenase SsuD/methylene tetrahydromethanopterin reductase-like flavin-dependent oxidoreductase (luciferase family)